MVFLRFTTVLVVSGQFCSFQDSFVRFITVLRIFVRLKGLQFLI